MLTFRCSSCSFEKPVPQKTLGKKAQCPRCGTITIIEEQPILLTDSQQDEEPADWLSATEETYSLPEDKDNHSREAPVSGYTRNIPQFGLPPRRSYLTTAILAAFFFSISMGVIGVILSKNSGAVLLGFLSGPLFGFLIAFPLTGKQVVIRFKHRNRFLKDLKRAFHNTKHDLTNAADPYYEFEYNKAEFLNKTHVHVGEKEAIILGPGTYVKKSVKQIADKYSIDWTGKKSKEDHGPEQTDSMLTVAYLVTAIYMFLFSFVIEAYLQIL